MPTVNRCDSPGSWHHVMNRGLARRPVFENRADIRFFLSRLAHAVRRGELEVHAYSVLATHFHLLVRSPRGGLSRAMMWIEHEYVRWFNRRRRRDGPLFRGRFRSKVVRSEVYWRTLVRYIDRNAVQAGVAVVASKYPFGSAFHFVRDRGPIWLDREVVESDVVEALGVGSYRPADYELVFGAGDSASEAWLVERRIECADDADDPLDDLVDAAPPEVRAWMRRKTCLADREKLGQPVVDPDSLMLELGARRAVDPGWSLRQGRRSRPGWQVVSAGLLRWAAGLSFVEIAGRAGISEATALRYAREHARRLQVDDVYASRSAEVLQAALRRGIFRRGDDSIQLATGRFDPGQTAGTSGDLGVKVDAVALRQTSDAVAPTG
jgi:REP element-mobilizing transposase RayT